MRVLIVEDDQALGKFLCKGLEVQGHNTEWASDGEAALDAARRQDPDLLILDLSLPKKDGIEVLEELRTWATSMSIVVLTGRNNVEERVRCLNLGADDCLLKPFSFHELIARCNAIARRRGVGAVSRLNHGPIAMDLLSRKVWHNGKLIELTGKEFALLEYMVRRGGECCSREDLLRDLWQVRAEAVTNVVDVYVNYLRKKLTPALPEDGAKAPLIETVRGAGYRLTNLKQTAA